MIIQTCDDEAQKIILDELFLMLYSPLNVGGVTGWNEAIADVPPQVIIPIGTHGKFYSINYCLVNTPNKVMVRTL